MSTVGRVRPGSMRGTPASQQKIAERLTILNERAPGMMTRLYNLKNQVRIRHIKSEGLVSILGVFVLFQCLRLVFIRDLGVLTIT